MDVLKQIDDDERFERTLRYNMSLSPEQKRKRWNAVTAKANKPCNHVAEYGQPFDVLEPTRDLPMMPYYGNNLPSNRSLGSH